MPLMYFGRLVGGVPNVGFERRRACAVIAVAEAGGVFAVGILLAIDLSSPCAVLWTCS